MLCNIGFLVILSQEILMAHMAQMMSSCLASGSGFIERGHRGTKRSRVCPARGPVRGHLCRQPWANEIPLPPHSEQWYLYLVPRFVAPSPASRRCPWVGTCSSSVNSGRIAGKLLLLVQKLKQRQLVYCGSGFWRQLHQQVAVCH